MSNRIFVVHKPIFIGSNRYLSQIKRKYGVKKAGFSGTLDPFACGTLIVAFGQYTKLFRFLKKTPKTYRATLWLGAKSDTLDIESIDKITDIKPFQEKDAVSAVNAFKGEFKYIPPKFCAKRIDGKHAYDLARAGKDVKLSSVTATIYNIKFLHYNHPFLTFEASVSEGAYIRSLGYAIAKKLGCDGALSYLERLREGAFIFEHESPLNPVDYLDLPLNHYLGDYQDFYLGRKLKRSDFKIELDGRYLIIFEDFFAIIEIKNDNVAYLLNKVKLCSY